MSWRDDDQPAEERDWAAAVIAAADLPFDLAGSDDEPFDADEAVAGAFNGEPTSEGEGAAAADAEPSAPANEGQGDAIAAEAERAAPQPDQVAAQPEPAA